MKRFLERIKLIDRFTTNIPLTENEFVKRLTLIEEGNVGAFSNLSDIFSSSKKVYNGKISFNNFTLKKRRRFIDANVGSATAQGSFRQHDKLLIIDTEINGFNKRMIPFFILMIIFYLLFLFMFSSWMKRPLTSFKQ